MPKSTKSEVEDRRKAILSEICKNEEVKVSNLAEKFNTSNMTIWRDLEQFEKNNYIEKDNVGGVKKKEELSIDPDIYARLKERHKEKVAIALKACELVKEGDFLGIDASTTTMELAKLLFQKNNLKIVSNNMLMAPILYSHPSVEFIATGGNLMMKGYSSEGDIAVDTINQFIYDKIFISGNALDSEIGLSNVEIFETATKKAFIKNAKTVIVLADSSKIGKIANHKCCEIDKIDIIITNASADTGQMVQIAEKGIKVIFAD